MKSTGFHRRTISLVGMVTLLILLSLFAVAGPLDVAGQEPTPRPTPTVPPYYIVLQPTQAVGQETVYILVHGYEWTAGQSVNLFWDDLVHFLGGPIAIDSSGEFQTTVQVNAAWATPGLHQVIAALDNNNFASAEINLVVPTPTNTPTTTLTPSPTVVTNTPGPTNTPAPTLTTQPTATMRPVTPVVTGYPVRPPVYPTSPPVYYPTSAVTRYPLPTNTRRPQPTSVPPTQTPLPTPTDTPTVTPSPTPTDTPTITPSPTPTDTPTITPSPTPTDTPTLTPTPTRTPEPGSPDASEPGAGLPASGGTFESIFFQGFIAAVLLVVLLTAFIIVVLVILLVVWRMMRMRRAEGQV
jgi:hypothetical protein